MSIFRSTIWFIKGLKEYTKGGYEAASKSFDASDLNVDISQRSYMITGANSGLGKATALALAHKAVIRDVICTKNIIIDRGDSQGGTVHMVCRNSERGQQAVTEILETTGNQNVHLHKLDTSKPRDVYEFVKTFKDSGYSLDVLINNAGCMVNTRELTEEGLEKNFATNTLGTHILTTSLIPVLSKSDQPRVVIVSSGGMLTQKLNISDLQFETLKPFDGTVAYAQNKRQQIVMTEQYANVFPNVQFSSMHPGWSDTPAVQTSMPGFYEKMKSRLRTVEQGADTIIWLAVSNTAMEEDSGKFFQDRRVVSTHLPLSWTKSSWSENETLMTGLDDVANHYKRTSRHGSGNEDTSRHESGASSQYGSGTSLSKHSKGDSSKHANGESSRNGNGEFSRQSSGDSSRHSSGDSSKHPNGDSSNPQNGDSSKHPSRGSPSIGSSV